MVTLSRSVVLREVMGRTPKTHLLAAAAAFAGVLQLVATLELGACRDRLETDSLVAVLIGMSETT